MFARIRSFLYRHRRKFLISGALIGTAIFLTRFTQRKIREWQEKEIRDLLERSKRMQHFEATQRTCDEMILNLASTLRKTVTSAINSESIVEQLQNGCENKVEAWNNLKIQAFSRTTVVVYAYAMLVATLRIQVNFIGARLYKESLNQNEKLLGNEASTKYLSLVSYFLEQGIVQLCDFINTKVKQVTSNISLKDELNLRDVEEVYWTIAAAVKNDDEKDPIKNLSKYVMDPQSMNENSETSKKLTKETLDLLGSAEVKNLIQNTIVRGFHVIVDHISDYFEQNANKEVVQNGEPVAGPSSAKDTVWENKPNKNTGLMTFTTARKPMAKIIPILNGQVPAVPKIGDMPSDWLQRLIFNDKYQALGANVYEAFSC